MEWLSKGALLVLIASFHARLLWAQPQVEVFLNREQAKAQILPPFLHALKPQIEVEVQNQLVLMNQGFSRNQFIEIPVADLLKDQKTEFLKLIRDDAQLKEDWNALLEKLNFLTVRISFELKILPQTESIDLQFQSAKEKRELIGLTGLLKAKPEIDVERISGFEIVEIDPLTGRGRTYPMPEAMLSLAGDFRLPFESAVDFQVEAALVENFAETDPLKMFQVQLKNWESTFKDVLLDEAQSRALVEKFLTEKKFYGFLRTLAKTNTVRGLLGPDEKSNSSLVEREVKAQLDARIEPMILWVEKDENGKLKPHLNAHKEKHRSRIERARAEGRLMLEAYADIPLSIESLDLQVDFEKQRARGKFQPHPEFQAKFDVKTFQLLNEWKGQIDDPLIKQIVDQLYGRNLFEGQKVEVDVHLHTRQILNGEWLDGQGGELVVPFGFKDGNPEIFSNRMKVDLPFLDEVKFQNLKIHWGWDRGEISLSPQSEVPLEEQLIHQLDAIVAAHEVVLGEGFFTAVETALLQLGEDQILKAGLDEKGYPKRFQSSDGTSFNLKVVHAPLVREGALKCTPQPIRAQRPLLGYRFLPVGLGMDILSSPSLLEFECEVTLPSRLDIQLSNVKSTDGNVSQIDFSFMAKDGKPQKLKTRARVIRDPVAGFLMVVPEQWDLDEVLAKYHVPTTGDGAPEFYGIDAHGWKGLASDIAKTPALLWTYLIRDRVNLGPTPEAVVTAGTLVPYALAAGKEGQVVDEKLRAAVSAEIHRTMFSLPEDAFKILNGDVLARRKLAKQPKALDDLPLQLLPIWANANGADRNWVDPSKVDLGLVGRGEARILEQLKAFQDSVPFRQGLGRFVIAESGQTARNAIELEVRDEAIKTVEGNDGVERVAEIISNPRLREIAAKIRSEGFGYIRSTVSRTASALELAVIDFLRTRPEGNDESQLPLSPLETLQQMLSNKILEKALERSRLNVPQVALPDFCGFSLLPFKDDDLGEFLGIVAKLDGSQEIPPIGGTRPEGSPTLRELMRAYDEEGMIPVSVPSDVFERIANHPENLSRVTALIREEAVKQPGISADDFQLALKEPKVRMREDGQAVVRVGVKIDQPATIFQTITSVIGFIPDAILSLLTGEEQRPFRTITGLPGWLADQISSPITDIDGYMELEIPVNLSVGDKVDRTGKLTGHYLQVWTDPDQLKVRNTEGWSSVFGQLAREKVEENANNFSRTIHFNEPLAVPDFEDLMSFELGNRLTSPLGRKTMVGIPTSREIGLGQESLYRGTFVFKLRPVPNPAYQTWPRILVETPQVPVAQPAQSE